MEREPETERERVALMETTVTSTVSVGESF